jgi:hypothetical protein
MLIAQHVLEQIAKNHGSRILEAQEYDPNICSFAHDPKNRAQLIAKTGQPLLRKTAFDFRDLRVQLFANNSYVRIMLFRELTEVFSLAGWDHRDLRSDLPARDSRRLSRVWPDNAPNTALSENVGCDRNDREREPARLSQWPCSLSLPARSRLR